jgi:hypothetical protein
MNVAVPPFGRGFSTWTSFVRSTAAFVTVGCEENETTLDGRM